MTSYDIREDLYQYRNIMKWKVVIRLGSAIALKTNSGKFFVLRYFDVTRLEGLPG